MIKKAMQILLAVTLVSCEYFEYHQLDGKVNLNSGRNEYNATILDSTKDKKENIRFVFMGDTHRNDHDTEAFVAHVNKRDDIDAVIHAGDVTDFGLKKEYEWTYRILEKLNVPHIVLIGNHDIIAHGDLIYRKVYGPENFTFYIGKYKFIAINTNRLEYKNPINIPDFNFIDEKIAEGHQDGTFVVMHSPPHCEQFDDEEIISKLSDRLSAISNLYCCLHGHTHKQSETEPLENRIKFYGCDNIAKKTYLVFDVTPNGYTYEVIEF